jgi:RNA polymerase sigma-70 factor, ECF subfamily
MRGSGVYHTMISSGYGSRSVGLHDQASVSALTYHQPVDDVIATPHRDRKRRPGTAVMNLESSFELLERYKGGDAEALDHLLSRYRDPLAKWARGRLPQWARDGADTQDLVQDAILQSLQHLTSFQPKGPGALHMYLRTAVLNRIRDAVRRVQRRPVKADIDPDLPSTDASPLQSAIGAEMLARYEAALLGLCEMDREAVIAYVEWGFSYEEIASALGKPSVAAARMTVRRAVLKLAKAMRPAQAV